MSTFLRLPATLVISGSFTCVHKKVEWLIVKPSTALAASTICHRESLIEPQSTTQSADWGAQAMSCNADLDAAAVWLLAARGIPETPYHHEVGMTV
jgi:hypothetical protein